MIKSELTNGTKIFVVRTEHYVSLGVFVLALRNHFYVHLSQKIEDLIREEETPERDFGYVDFKSKNFEEELETIITNEIVINKLTKKKAEEILKHSLKFYGREGQIEDADYEASYERGLALDVIYKIVREWVIKKYPHLKPNEE